MKTARVHFQSDDERIARQRRRKVLVKEFGRVISQTTVANGEDVDAALLTLIHEKPLEGEGCRRIIGSRRDAFHSERCEEELEPKRS